MTRNPTHPDQAHAPPHDRFALLHIEAQALAELPAEPLDFLDAHQGDGAEGLITFQRAARLLGARPLACEAAIAKLACRGTTLPRRDAAGALLALISAGAIRVFQEDGRTGTWGPADRDLVIVLASNGDLVGVAWDPDRPNVAARCAVPAAPFLNGLLDGLEEERQRVRDYAAQQAAAHARAAAGGGAHARWQAEQDAKLRDEGARQRAEWQRQEDARRSRLPNLAQQLRDAEARASKES